MIHTGWMRYPGDPRQRVEWVSVDAFLAAMPGRTITITTEGEGTVVIPLGDDVLCDVCGQAVAGETEVAIVEGRRLHCPACTAEWVTPYVEGGTDGE